VAILALMRARGNEDWLERAGEIVAERPETADELEHLHRERV
jgi:hypothetical protein